LLVDIARLEEPLIVKVLNKNYNKYLNNTDDLELRVQENKMSKNTFKNTIEKIEEDIKNNYVIFTKWVSSFSLFILLHYLYSYKLNIFTLDINFSLGFVLITITLLIFYAALFIAYLVIQIWFLNEIDRVYKFDYIDSSIYTFTFIMYVILIIFVSSYTNIQRLYLIITVLYLVSPLLIEYGKNLILKRKNINIFNIKSFGMVAINALIFLYFYIALMTESHFDRFNEMFLIENLIETFFTFMMPAVSFFLFVFLKRKIDKNNSYANQYLYINKHKIDNSFLIILKYYILIVLLIFTTLANVFSDIRNFSFSQFSIGGEFIASVRIENDYVKSLQIEEVCKEVFSIRNANDKSKEYCLSKAKVIWNDKSKAYLIFDGLKNNDVKIINKKYVIGDIQYFSRNQYYPLREAILRK